VRSSGAEYAQDEKQIQSARGEETRAVSHGHIRGTQARGGTKTYDEYLSVYNTQGEEVYIQGKIWVLLQKT
jgi:hypothetical protein